jgi:hypothetical protein
MTVTEALDLLREHRFEPSDTEAPEARSRTGERFEQVSTLSTPADGMSTATPRKRDWVTFKRRRRDRQRIARAAGEGAR